MKELLFESNQGIFFYKEVKNGVCTVKVQTRGTKRMHTIHRYTFPNVKLSLMSPFLSWENLNCCNGWTYDETYLHTAVQEGKKLYAGCDVYLEEPNHISKARDDLAALARSLPDYCIAGEEQVKNEKFFPFFICRRGRLQDFYNLEHVFSDYELLGITLSNQDYKRILENCRVELKQFASCFPFDYSNVGAIPDVITTGLLLGYPLESTASILLNWLNGD